MLKRAWELMYPELKFPGAGVWDPAVHPPELDVDMGSSNGSPSPSLQPNSSASGSQASAASSASSRAATAQNTSAAPSRSPVPNSKTSAATTPGSPRTGASQLFEHLHIETPERVRIHTIDGYCTHLYEFMRAPRFRIRMDASNVHILILYSYVIHLRNLSVTTIEEQAGH